MPRVVPWWLFGLAVLPGLPLGGGEIAAQTGRIEGTVALAPSVSARKPRFRPYAEYGPGATPSRTNPDTNELTHVIVYIDSLKGPFADPATSEGPPTLEQLNERFVPHLLPVLKGATVAFPNGDPIFHNVFSLSSVRSFDLGRYPKGASKSVRFDRAGLVQVFCHIHSDMSAIIMVLENPYFAVPGMAGHYAIEGIPAGVYRLVAWHERIDPIARQVRVLPGETSTVDFTIPLPQEPDRP